MLINRGGWLHQACLCRKLLHLHTARACIFFKSSATLRLWRGARQRELWRGAHQLELRQGEHQLELWREGTGGEGGQISRSESWVPDEKWEKKAAVFWSPLNLKNKSRDRNRGRIVAALFSPRRPGGGIFVAGCISEGQSPPPKKNRSSCGQCSYPHTQH